MASNFDRWEKDPFFLAAEEVQESADRMESAYRTWIHETKDSSSVCDPNELRRDVHTALGTAKWQLEEFERAVDSSYVDSSAEDARARHRQFIVAISDQVSNVENSLHESFLAEGKTSLPWVRLDEGERDELALFLTGPSADGKRSSSLAVPCKEEEHVDTGGLHGEPITDCSKNSCHSAEWNLPEVREEALQGHRRTASASADIGDWKIDIVDDGLQHKSSDKRPDLPPSQMLSFSGISQTMESTSQYKWSKNGFRKWKGGDRHQEADTAPLQSHQLSRGINTFYERSKSCLDSCDESYEKQLHGWVGAIQRQLQRSQYYLQYSRPIQAILWVVFALFLIGKLRKILKRGLFI